MPGGRKRGAACGRSAAHRCGIGERPRSRARRRCGRSSRPASACRPTCSAPPPAMQPPAELGVSAAAPGHGACSRPPRAVDQGAAHVAAAQRHRPLDPHVGQRRTAARDCPARTAPALEVVVERPRPPRRASTRASISSASSASARRPSRRPGARRGRRGTPAIGVGPHGQARGHGVAAAGQQQALVERRLDGAAEVDARLRAAGALADVGDADRGRSPPPGGDSARAGGSATMPITPGCQSSRGDHDGRRVRIEVGLGLDGGDGLLEDLASRPSLRWALSASSSSASALASSGSSVESRRAPRSERPMRPPALIRGPRMKPAWKTLAGALGAGDLHQRLQARIGPGRHHLQPLGGQRAVEADQPGHVADGAQRGQVEPLAQVRLGRGRRTGRAAAPRGSAPPAARR